MLTRRVVLGLAMTSASLWASTGSAREPVSCVVDSPALDKVGYGNAKIETNGELLVMRATVAQSGTVFDVGAGTGDWTAQLLKLRPKVRVFAFEPIPVLVERMRQRFVGADVSIQPRAVSRAPGTAQFDYYPQHWEYSGLYNRPEVMASAKETPRKIEVQLVTVDDFCREHQVQRIDLLKIDTEGAELDVLLGAREMLRKHAVQAIQIEYGGTYRDAKITLAQVYELLRSLRYSVYRVAADRLIHVPVWRAELETYGFANYVATPEESRPACPLSVPVP